VLIGVSTGGPTTLERVLSDIRAPLAAPVLIALHTPNRYLKALTKRLAARSGLDVRSLEEQTLLKPRQIVVAGADFDVSVGKQMGVPLARPVPIDPSRNWHPSIDRMVETAMRSFPASDLLAVQLTGMGDDGAASMAQLHSDSGYTIAESEETAVIYGMPRELVDRGGASAVLPNTQIGEALMDLVGTLA